MLNPRQARVSVSSNGTPGAIVGDAASSPGNVESVTGEQGPRPRSTSQVPKLPPQIGTPVHIQPRHSRGPSTIERENNLDDPSHKWVINLSSTPLTPGSKVLTS